MPTEAPATTRPRYLPSRRRGPVALALIGAIAAGTLLPALAPSPQAAFAATTAEAIDAMDIDAGGAAIVTGYDRQQLAPGVELVSVNRIEAAGRLEFDVLVADLGSGEVRADYLYPGTVSDAKPVTDMLVDSGAVAGVNGSFFDINNSNAPNGVGVSATDGAVTVPDGINHQPVVFTEDGLGHFADVLLESTVTVNGEPSDITVSALNSWSVANGNIGLFTDAWGDYDRGRALQGSDGLEVIINADGVVQSIGNPGEGQLPAGVQALVGRGSGADALSSLAVGDAVAIEYGVRSDVGEIVAALGANHLLLENGSVVSHSDTAVHPRTGLGFNADGSVMYLVVVDGRQNTSRGLSLMEFGQLFSELGANDAVNLDGGGSSTLGAVKPGDDEATVPHNPSDGGLRPVPNGLGLFVDAGSGEVAGYRLETRMQAADANRVFPGLTRTVVAKGFDEKGTAVHDAQPDWLASSAAATVTDNGDRTATVTGAAPGAVEITAATGDASGSTQLQVLGELERIEVSPTVVQLTSEDDVKGFTVYGYDSNGYRAPIEAADIELVGDGAEAFEITPGTTGTFAVTSDAEGVSASLTVKVGDEEARVAMTSGYEELVVFDFEDVDTWRTTGARSTSSVVPAPGAGHDGGQAVEMTYDFSQSTATRTANARPEAGHPGMPIPGQPSEITLWVRGESDGSKNADTYVGYSDADGSWSYIYGAAPQGDEWQLMSYPVPEGTAYPISLQMVSGYETRAAEQYSGKLWFDDVVAFVPPSVEAPQPDLVTDDVIGAAGSTDESPLRVAVVSDAQFVGRNPESGAVQGARDAFQEVMAAQPDLLVINGDFVDEATPEDFELAQQIIDEELSDADFPWIYAPGNHEIMGGEIDNFEAAFGDTHGYMDVDGTRMIWLDTSTGELSHDYDQVQMFRQALDEAAIDPEITDVLVFQHMPLDDPLVAKASQLSNRLDAEMEREWLEEFRTASGKSIALVAGHVGIFHAATEDGIPYIINGNSGKNPTASSFGSFTGWTMLGVDPSMSGATDPREWLTAEVRTRVDSLELEGAPPTLRAGATETVTPSLVQDDTRDVEVEWPVSHTWFGDGVHIGAAADAPVDALAAFDPATGELTGLQAGEASLSLRVNDTVATVEFAVDGITGTVPTVSGTPRVGEVLTADAGDWGPEGVALSYQWFASGAPIEGATEPTVTLTEQHEGTTITVVVRGELDGYAPVELESTPTAAVVPVGAPEPTPGPTTDPTPGPTTDPTGDPEPTTGPTIVPTTVPATPGDSDGSDGNLEATDGGPLAFAAIGIGALLIGAAAIGLRLRRTS